MSTMWALIEVCFADARKAEDVLRDFSARRELHLDPDTALAGFVLWTGRLPARETARKVLTPRPSRAYTPARP